MKQVGQKGLIFVTSQKVNGNLIFTDYWNFLVLNFSGMGIRSVFELKGWMKRWYLLITKKFFIWNFQWWEKPSFFSQKCDGKMIFAWSFWAFHDISGLGKYGFFVQRFFLFKYIWIMLWWILCTFLEILWAIKFSVVSAIFWIALSSFKWICSGLFSMIKMFPTIFTVVSDFIWLFFYYFYLYFC